MFTGKESIYVSKSASDKSISNKAVFKETEENPRKIQNALIRT